MHTHPTYQETRAMLEQIGEIEDLGLRKGVAQVDSRRLLTVCAAARHAIAQGDGAATGEKLRQAIEIVRDIGGTAKFEAALRDCIASGVKVSYSP